MAVPAGAPGSIAAATEAGPRRVEERGVLFEAITGDRLESLHNLLDSHRGECSVLFEVELNDGQIARIQPNQFVRVRVTPELTNAITRALPEATVELAVQRWGELSPNLDNVVLVEHALTGDSHVIGAPDALHPLPGWWDGVVGPGAPLDTAPCRGR